MNKVTENLPEAVRIGDLAIHLGCTRQTIANMVRRGDLPEPMRLGRSRPFWPRFEVEHILKRPSADKHEAR